MPEETPETLKTQRDLLARALAGRTAQLEAATREFDQFIYSVSHDLRAPLRAIEGFAQILAEDYARKLDSDGQRCVTILASGARKATLLIDDLLALSRSCGKPFAPRTVNMNELVAHVIQELGPSAGKAKFNADPLPDAWGDPAWLTAALEQLLRNAAKFSRNQEQPVIEISATTESEQTIYRIRDNGAGFDQKYADRLFGIFQRLHADTEFEGRGVGLAIVHRMINRHRGKTWAEGKVGNGATFYFSLPTREAASMS